jgi:hypothetical protein
MLPLGKNSAGSYLTFGGNMPKSITKPLSSSRAGVKSASFLKIHAQYRKEKEEILDAGNSRPGAGF